MKTNILLILLLPFALFSQDFEFGNGNNEFNKVNKLYSNVYVAKGTLAGTTAEIYKAQLFLNADSVFYTTQRYRKPSTVLDPNAKYITMGWADFFTPEDPTIHVPLYSKYGVTATFYRQIKPLTVNPLQTNIYNRAQLKMIEQIGSWDADHGFLHVNGIYGLPLADGRNYPSNDDLRVARADGTNELGHAITSTVLTTTGATSLNNIWPEGLGAKRWVDLTDDDCAAFRRSMSAYWMPMNTQDSQKVLETLDFLSNRYCKTTGTSVLNADYVTRTPNTIGGVEPDNDHRIQGGIFQGASTTNNHELWERITIIMNSYKQEFEGKRKPHEFWGTPGGGAIGLYYRIQGPTTQHRLFTDKQYTKKPSGSSTYTSSITGQTRSWHDVLRSAGYTTGMFAQATAYGDLSWDSLTRPESSRMYKKNSFYNKIDYVGDGYVNSLRCFQPIYTEADITNALMEADVAKYLYELNKNDARFGSYTAYTATANFYHFLNEMTKFIAWGLIPDFVGDNESAGDLVKRASQALSQEAFLQFCKRANIGVISHEQGAKLSLESKYNYSPQNWFPNYNFERTCKDVLSSDEAPLYPDGWVLGTVDLTDTSLYIVAGGTPARPFIRQYAIKPGNYSYSITVKGRGTFSIRTILNKDRYNTTSGNAFTIVSTKNISSIPAYTTHTGTFTVPDANAEVYAETTDPKLKCYQNYMRGLGDKICGLQIEFTLSAGDSIRLKKPIITKTD